MDNIENLLIKKLNQIEDKDLGLILQDLNSIKKITKSNDTYKVNIELVPPYIDFLKDISLQLSKDPAFYNLEEIKFEVSKKIANRSERVFFRDIENIIVVASGKGGVGKSAISANIAGSLSLRGYKVGVLDADIYGPSQPTMFGLSNEFFEAVELEEGKVLLFPNENYNIKVASIGFAMNRQEAAIIRGPLLAKYFIALVEQVEWGELDFLVIDLPPGTGDVHLTLAQKLPVTGAVVITTPQEISLADVRRSVSMFRRVNIPVFGIIENMSYFIPPDDKEKKYYIFGEGGGRSIAEEFEVELLGEIPIDMEIRLTGDNGRPLVLSDKVSPAKSVIHSVVDKIVSKTRKQNYIEYLNKIDARAN